ncbi:MAG: hypothetical protein AAFR59_10320, partial [Bacteroidota bacterium]
IRLSDGSQMTWKYINCNQNKWQISDEQNQIIQFKELWNRGKITHQDTEVSSIQMMMGLALHQYLWNMRLFAIGGMLTLLLFG